MIRLRKEKIVGLGQLVSSVDNFYKAPFENTSSTLQIDLILLIHWASTWTMKCRTKTYFPDFLAAAKVIHHQGNTEICLECLRCTSPRGEALMSVQDAEAVFMSLAALVSLPTSWYRGIEKKVILLGLYKWETCSKSAWIQSGVLADAPVSLVGAIELPRSTSRPHWRTSTA